MIRDPQSITVKQRSLVSGFALAFTKTFLAHQRIMMALTADNLPKMKDYKFIVGIYTFRYLQQIIADFYNEWARLFGTRRSFDNALADIQVWTMTIYKTLQCADLCSTNYAYFFVSWFRMISKPGWSLQKTGLSQKSANVSYKWVTINIFTRLPI